MADTRWMAFQMDDMHDTEIVVFIREILLFSSIHDRPDYVDLVLKGGAHHIVKGSIHEMKHMLNLLAA